MLQNTFQGSGCIVDSIIYDAVENPNRCSIQYHDARAKGKLELFVNSRQSSTNEEGRYHSFENLRQSSVRQVEGQRASQTVVDYAVELDLLFDRSSSSNPKTESFNRARGLYRILSYVEPQDDLYFIRPNRPVAAFDYDIVISKQM
eukprot:CAMPEP_0182426834 /NCGR_PEP_ID=MMETSP1167-20130531/13350_1 /TAXON_ID=2988 /ORGANISM="Mallomonas Sp, Strain CCMP3275" /LENGTH=145 /DNA_ID=CAMNT_0024608551 /DNA_START=607 /DNA_END=1044 /DNA_ORIENTATION=+